MCCKHFENWLTNKTFEWKKCFDMDFSIVKRMYGRSLLSGIFRSLNILSKMLKSASKVTNKLHEDKALESSQDFYRHPKFQITNDCPCPCKLPIQNLFYIQKGKQKSPGRATNRSRSQPLTLGGREKVIQITGNVCTANKQMHDKHKDQLPLPQARWSIC